MDRGAYDKQVNTSTQIQSQFVTEELKHSLKKTMGDTLREDNRLKSFHSSTPFWEKEKFRYTNTSSTIYEISGSK